MPKPNYAFEKRQKEIARKKKKEDKRQQKAAADAVPRSGAQTADNGDDPVPSSPQD